MRLKGAYHSRLLSRSTPSSYRAARTLCTEPAVPNRLPYGGSRRTPAREVFHIGRRVNHVTIIIKHEEPNGRRQIAVRALRDGGNQIRQGAPATRCNLLETAPERIFEADAGLVTSDDDRSLDDRRFHAQPLSSPTSDAFTSLR